MHDIGINAVLEWIPDGGPYYLTIDADGLDPTIMPAVNAPTPGGLNWIQIHKLIHGLVNKGRVSGMDFVEISPAFENGNMSLVHAERLIFVHWGYGPCGILRLVNCLPVAELTNLPASGRRNRPVSYLPSVQ